MAGRLYERIGIKIACIFFLAFSLALISCGGNGGEGTANAQVVQGRLIQMFALTDGTVVLSTDAEPTIEFIDGATKYTLNSNGTLNYASPITGGTIDLFPNDIVIERPGLTLTVIQIT